MFKLISKLLGTKNKRQTVQGLNPKENPQIRTKKDISAEDIRNRNTPSDTKETEQIHLVQDTSKIKSSKNINTLLENTKENQKKNKTINKKIGIASTFKGDNDGIQEDDLKQSMTGLKSFIEKSIDKLRHIIEGNLKSTSKQLNNIAAVTKDNKEINADSLGVQKESLEMQKDAAYDLKHKAKESLKNVASKMKVGAVKALDKAKTVGSKLKPKGGILATISKLFAAGYLLKTFWPLIKEKIIPFVVDKIWPIIKENLGEVVAGLGITAMILKPIGTLKLAIKSIWTVSKLLAKTSGKLALSAAKFTIDKIKKLTGFDTEYNDKKMSDTKKKSLGKKTKGPNLSKAIKLGKKGLGKGLGYALKAAKLLTRFIPFLGIAIMAYDIIDTLFPKLFSKIGNFITDFAPKVWSFITDGFGKIGDWITEKLQPIMNVIKPTWESLTEFVSDIGTLGATIWENVTSGISQLGTYVANKFSDSENIAEFGSSIWLDIKDKFGEIATWITDKFGQLKSMIENKLWEASPTVAAMIFGGKTLTEEDKKELDLVSNNIQGKEKGLFGSKVSKSGEKLIEKVQKLGYIDESTIGNSTIEDRENFHNLPNKVINGLIKTGDFSDEDVTWMKEVIVKKEEKKSAMMKAAEDKKKEENEENDIKVSGDTKIPLQKDSGITDLVENKKSNKTIDKKLGMKSFAVGGYTGIGKDGDIAGIVHKNEYVLTPEDLKELDAAATDGANSNTIKRISDGKAENIEAQLTELMQRRKEDAKDSGKSYNIDNRKLTNVTKAQARDIEEAQRNVSDANRSGDWDKMDAMDKKMDELIRSIQEGTYQNNDNTVIVIKEPKKLDANGEDITATKKTKSMGTPSIKSVSILKPDTSTTFTPEPVPVKANIPSVSGGNDKEIKSVDDIKESDIFKGVKLKNMNPDVEHNVKAMGYEYKEKYGKKLQLNSTGRSIKEQTKLYNEMLKKNHGVSDGSVAFPGGSMHNYGLAVDAQSNQLDIAEKSGLMSKYGFHRNIHKRDGSLETWHMEAKGINKTDIRKAGKAAIKKGLDIDELVKTGQFTKQSVKKIDANGQPIKSKPKDGPASDKEIVKTIAPDINNETLDLFKDKNGNGNISNKEILLDIGNDAKDILEQEMQKALAFFGMEDTAKDFSIANIQDQMLGKKQKREEMDTSGVMGTILAKSGKAAAGVGGIASMIGGGVTNMVGNIGGALGIKGIKDGGLGDKIKSGISGFFGGKKDEKPTEEIMSQVGVEESSINIAKGVGKSVPKLLNKNTQTASSLKLSVAANEVSVSSKRDKTEQSVGQATKQLAAKTAVRKASEATPTPTVINNITQGSSGKSAPQMTLASTDTTDDNMIGLLF